MRPNGHKLHASQLTAVLRPAVGDKRPLDGRLELCPSVVAKQAHELAIGKRWRDRSAGKVGRKYAANRSRV